MALGEKIFEGTGNVVAFRITKVHPVEGTTMEVSFVEDLKGIGKFPSGKNTGSGTINHYPHGSVDASYNGFVTFPEGDTYMWWAHGRDGRSDNGNTLHTAGQSSWSIVYTLHIVACSGVDSRAFD